MTIQNYMNLGGTVRACPPEETKARILPLLKPLGITRVANVTGLDHIGIEVAVCIRPNSKHLSVSQGKGLSADFAYVSAVMESIEAYHVENAPEPTLTGTYARLHADYPLLDVSALPAGHAPYEDPKQVELGWLQGENLITRTPCYMPHGLLSIDTTKPHREYALLLASSNGLASGNTFDEALCHALYELIERDAYEDWLTYDDRMLQRRGVCLESLQSSQNKTLLTQLKEADMELCLYDMTTSLGIPSYVAYIEGRAWAREALGSFSGSGAHLNREVAVARAITEAVQARLTLISGSRDDVFPDKYYGRFQWSALIENSSASAKLNLHEPTYMQPAGSFLEDSQQMLDKLEASGHTQIAVYDHTRDDIGVAVVQVIAPGLRFMTAGG